MKTLKRTIPFNWNFPLKSLIVLSLAVIFLASCKNDDDDLPQPDLAALNVVNASPGQTAFNFALDNQIVNGPALTFTDQTGYLSAYSGSRKFDVTLGGTTQTVLTDTLNLETDKYYSIFITGQTPLSTLLTEDDLTAPATGKAKIRFIQLSPDGGSLALGIKGGAELFPAQAFRTASEFISVDPGEHVLELSNSGGTALTETNLTVTAGKMYTIWAGGLLAGTGDAAILLHVDPIN